MENSLENVIRYESAAVAGMNAEKNPLDAVTAMRDYYNSINMEDDYLVQDGLKKAQESLMLANQTGQKMTLANTSLLGAISNSAHKYEKAFNETEVSGLVKYLGGSCNIPKEAEQGLLEYKDVMYKDLAEKVKAKDTTKEEKEKIEKVLMLISELKKFKLEQNYMKMRTKSVEATARHLYSEPEENKAQ